MLRVTRQHRQLVHRGAQHAARSQHRPEHGQRLRDGDHHQRTDRLRHPDLHLQGGGNFAVRDRAVVEFEIRREHTQRVRQRQLRLGKPQWQQQCPAIKTQLGGAGQCNLNNVTQVGTQGNINSAPDYWNSRFGILPPSGKSLGVTDFTGYGYNDTTWPQGANAYPDFVAKRKAFTAYQGDAAMGWTNPNGTKGTPSPAAAYKSGADRRTVLAPIVDCSGFASSNRSRSPAGPAC